MNTTIYPDRYNYCQNYGFGPKTCTPLPVLNF